MREDLIAIFVRKYPNFPIDPPTYEEIVGKIGY